MELQSDGKITPKHVLNAGFEVLYNYLVHWCRICS